MSIQAIGTKVISTLGNKESLLPIMIKDGVDSTALTVKSFKEGGFVEGKDRFIDEFGTQAIWIGGIPLYKKIIDKTAYKYANLNPGVDPRIIANHEYYSWAVKNANGLMSNSKTQSVKNALTDCLKDGGKLAKNLYKGKIIAATALTLITFFALTKSKHKNTKDSVIKSMNKEVSDTFVPTTSSEPEIFASFNKISSSNAKPSFKGAASKVVDAIMFNPVHNMKIIDAGITTERLACSRNKVEFAEHAIKEGSFLFFLYGMGGMIENGINKFSAKFLNKPIDLAIDVLMDDKFASALADGKKIASDVAKAPFQNGSLTEKLDFIVNNPDNIVIQAAKKSGIVSTVKDKAGNVFVDTSKFIDMNAMDDLAKNLQNIDSKFKGSNETVKSFLNKAKALKVGSVMANIGISCLFLGYIVPKAVYKYREMKTGSTKFHVAEEIKSKNKKKDV